MNVFDRQFQPGSPFLIAVFAAVALVSIGLVVIQPAYRYLALMVLVLALNGWWKQYQARSIGSPR